MPLLSEHRWYLYRSTPKIDMLYEQIFGSSKVSRKAVSIATPLGTLSVDAKGDEPGIEEKLRRVETELRETKRIGTLAEPGDYVEGLMPMRWGLFNDAECRPADEPPLVFFGGWDKEEPLVVGLGGSTMNVVGHKGASSTHSRSSARAITRWLVAGVRDDAPPQLPDWWDMDHERDDLFEGVAIALHYLRPPTQNLQFIAKTLETGVLEGCAEHFIGVKRARVIVGTPLWVAAAAPIVGETSRWGLDDQWEVVEREREEDED